MKVNIGGQKNRGRNWPDWVIVDTRGGAEVQLNLMEKSLPFKDGSVDMIYSSHTFEHIYPDHLPTLFADCFRVLKKNASIRIVVPDIDIAVRAYVNKRKDFLRHPDNPDRCVGLPDMPVCNLSGWFFTYEFDPETKERRSGGHVTAFNYQLMYWFLDRAGFVDINKRRYGQCLPEFEGCDSFRYKHCSLYAEARKPR